METRVPTQTSDRVFIFDTTLRDGEQSPGASLTPDQKLAIAWQLARLGVDVIEAGFPLSSPGDFEAVQRIARQIRGPMITALARAARPDIDAVWQAVQDAERKQIHMVLSVSDIHIERKLRSNRRDVLRRGVEAVAYARSLCDDVEYSPEDAGRADLEYLFETLEAVIDAGATVVNIPDTTGYTLPNEFGALIASIRENVRNIDRALISVHCHNDLGLSTANSIAAVLNGARRVECTINGIGERAGNASLEEIVMLLHTREPSLGLWSGIETTEIARTSRLVSRLTGYPVQPNKAIVGRNAFAHEAGIHQDGVLKERTTYEIMDATTVGLESNAIVLGKHSGRHALHEALEEMGFRVDGQALNAAFKRFKELADRKKQITAMDLEALVTDELREEIPGYTLEWFEVEASSRRPPHAKVSVSPPEGPAQQGSFTGDGPIDAVFHAIDAATGVETKLRDFQIGAVTEGQDALGEVSVVVESHGQSGSGQAVSTDIIEAAARAYVRALSVAVARSQTADGVVGLPATAS